MKMRKLGRILLRTIVALIILAIASAIAGVLVFRSGWFREKVRERIIAEVQKSTGARLEIGNFNFDWEHLSATLSSVALHGKEPADEAPLLRVQNVTLGLRVISAFERKVDLSFLRLDQPVLRIVFYPDGSTNFLPPHDRTTWAEDLLDIAVRRYEVLNGLVEYDDRKIPLNLRGENLRASMEYERRGPRYRGDLAMRNVRVMAGGALPLDLDTSAQFVIERSRIQFTRLRVGTKQSRADLSGVLDDIRAPHGNLTMKAVVAVRDAVTAFQLPLAPAGTAALDGQVMISLGKTFDFSLNGRLNARGIGYARDRLKIDGADLRADLRMNLDGVNLRGVTLTALGSTVTGSASLAQWKQFHFDGTIRDLKLRDAARIATDRPIPWNGIASGSFSVDAVAGEPNSKIQTALAITPVSEPNASGIEGTIEAVYDQAAGTLDLQHSHLATSGTEIDVSGILGQRLEIRAQSTRLEDLLPALAMADENAPREVPVKLTNGRATFSGTVSGSLDDPQVNGQLTLTNASVQGHGLDRLAGDVAANRREIKVQRLTVVRGATTVEGSGQVSGKFDDGVIAAQLNVRNISIADLAKETGLNQPVSGTANAAIRLSGTVQRPEGEISLQVEKPVAFDEQADRLRAKLKYSPNQIEITSGDISNGPASASFNGMYRHPGTNWKDADWKNGDVTFALSTQGMQLSRVKAFAKLQPSLSAQLDATISGKFNGAGRVSNGEFSLSSINADTTARAVTWDTRALGDLKLIAETHGADVAVHAATQIRDVSIDGQGTWRLSGDMPGSGTVHFSRASVATLHDLALAGGPLEQSAAPFEGFVDGANATINLSIKKPSDFHAELTLGAIQVYPRPTQTLRLGVQAQDLVLKNSQPVVIDISARQAQIRSVEFTGRDTTLNATGAISFEGKTGADLSVRGSMNLIVLQLLNPDLVARGNATVQAAVRGSMKDPQVTGRMDLKNASLYLGDLPNGVDNANGSVVFDLNRATIERLSAETGGGTVDISGFIGFGSPLVYRLQAIAQKVRVRYPEDVSVTFNATLALNGTSDSSTVSGTMTLVRAAFTPRADLAQVLAQAARPVPAPASSDYIRGMQFDVRLESDPNFELQTSLTRNLEAEVDLRLRGTPLRPALVGTASVSAGEAEIFGNKYTVNRGDIRFVNPVKIDPILDMDLETKARGVTVNIGVSGTLQKLNVNYSSDPPMQPREIIALLAVGRTPSDTAGLSPDQYSTSSSTLVEAGGGLISQAITAQLSSRLQRFFGASRVRIDPTITGIDYLPQARLTVEQQVSKDITMTYITNLNRTQEQIVQIEWDFSRQWSAVAVREANGLFGIDVQFRKRFK
jgi:translocation and assembly module TamB